MKKLVPTSAVLIPTQAVCVHKGPVFEVYDWQQKLFDGSTATFEMAKRADTAVIYCLVDNKIIVLDEEQPNGLRQKKFPTGRIEPSDGSVTRGAQREVREETGYSFNNWRLINVIQPHNQLEWFIYFYVASDVADKTEPRPGPGEKISLALVELDQLKQQLTSSDDLLSKNKELFMKVQDLTELTQLKEFSGQEIDR